MVKTRTVVQTRTHAQKYFQKLNKGGNIDDDLLDDFDVSPDPSTALSGKKSSMKKKSSIKKINLSEQHNDIYDDENDGAYQTLGRLSNSMIGSGVYSPLPPAGTNQSLPISILVPPEMRESFPEPSPAACGKRKFAELAAAKVLASSSSNQDQDMEGAQVYSNYIQHLKW